MKKILYRPHRGGLHESMKECKVFENINDMLEYIVAQNALKIPLEDKPGAYNWIYPFKKDDLFLGDKKFYDAKTDWVDCRFVKTYKYFNEFNPEGIIIGHCSEYDHNLKADLMVLIKKYFRKRN